MSQLTGPKNSLRDYYRLFIRTQVKLDERVATSLQGNSNFHAI